MKYLSTLLFFMVVLSVSGQNNAKLFPGFPDRSSKLDVLPVLKIRPRDMVKFHFTGGLAIHSPGSG
jgi:hypothetical protein